MQTVGELDARVGDVDGVRQHAKAAGAHLLHRRLGERQHEIEVVDHQVEHHVDIRAARLEGRQPLDVDEERLAALRGERLKSGG